MSLEWNLLHGFLYLEIGLGTVFFLAFTNPHDHQKIFNNGVILTVCYAAVFNVHLIKNVLPYVDMTEYDVLTSDDNVRLTFLVFYLLFVLCRLIIMINKQSPAIFEMENQVRVIEVLKKQVEYLQRLQKTSEAKKEAEQSKKLTDTQQNQQSFMTDEMNAYLLVSLVETAKSLIIGPEEKPKNKVGTRKFY